MSDLDSPSLRGGNPDWPVSFDVLPAIDLLDGQSVRLRKGKRDSAHHVHADPLAQVEGYIASGARWIHVVNLNAAFGDPADHQGARASLAMIRKLIERSKSKQSPLMVQVGGGIRSVAFAESLFELGVDRLVIGTWVLRDPEAVCQLARAYGEGVVVGLDALHGKLAVQGWTESHAEIDLHSFAARLADGGVQRALFTQIESDGMLTGVHSAPLLQLVKESGLRVIASGGVAGIEDVADLAKLASRGICGVVIGKALHAGRLQLSEAVAYQTKNDF